MWQFKICVREGAPGWADDEEHKSIWYQSFEECYKAYVDFDPSKWWKNLRYVQTEVICYKCNDQGIHNFLHSGKLCYNPKTIKCDLGIEESEYLKCLNMS